MTRRLFLPGLACVALVAAAVAAPVATRLDWDSVSWPVGSLGESYTIGSGDVELQWTGAVGNLIQSRPRIARSETGGLFPPEDSLSVRVNYGGGLQELVLTMDFTHPGGVTDVEFTVFDIDAWGFFLNPYIDELEVTAFNATGQVDPSSVGVVNPAFVQFDGVNTVTGQQPLFDSEAPDGNATFTFNQPGITRVRLVYRSPPGALGNPGSQYISIHDIDFTYEELLPELQVQKQLETLSDPFSGGANAKAIPGATLSYTVEVTNTGPGSADVDTVALTDPIPLNTALVVTDFDGSTPGPVQFEDGPTSSGLTYTFGGLGDNGDDIEFSADGGSTFSYTPVDLGNGTDPAVTHIRVNPKGVLPGFAGNAPEFAVRFKVVVR